MYDLTMAIAGLSPIQFNTTNVSATGTTMIANKSSIVLVWTKSGLINTRASNIDRMFYNEPFLWTISFFNLFFLFYFHPAFIFISKIEQLVLKTNHIEISPQLWLTIFSLFSHWNISGIVSEGFWEPFIYNASTWIHSEKHLCKKEASLSLIHCTDGKKEALRN